MTAPTVGYWRLYTDTEGVSRWARCAMTRFELKSMQPPAAPQWQGEPARGDFSVLVTVQPVGWRGDWHENPKPQWIVPLSGRWWVEAMDGEPARIRPRRILLRRRPEMPGARRAQRVICSGTLGDAPAALMVIQFNDPAAAPAFEAGELSMPGELLVDLRSVRQFSIPASRGLTLANAPLEKLARRLSLAGGSVVWMGDWDALLFQDLPNDRTMIWRDAEAASSVWRAPSHLRQRSGARPARPARCPARIAGARSCAPNTTAPIATLVDRHAGKRLNSPNDVVVAADGAIWFTDPLYGISNDYEGGVQTSEQRPALYRYDPARDRLTIAASDFDGPNGLAFSADGRRLYVAETGDQTKPDPAQFIRAFDVGEDGALSGGEVFHRVDPGYCDGLKTDARGHVWCSAADGVHCLDPQAELIGKIRIPYRVANLCFGGRARNRLFIAASHTLYALYLNTRGALDY